MGSLGGGVLVERTWERSRRRRPVTHTGVTDPGVAPFPRPPRRSPAPRRRRSQGGSRRAAGRACAGSSPRGPRGRVPPPGQPRGAQLQLQPRTAPRRRHSATGSSALRSMGTARPRGARHGPQRPQRLAVRSRGGGGARPSHSACKRQPSLHRGSAGSRGIPLESEGCLTHALHR